MVTALLAAASAGDAAEPISVREAVTQPRLPADHRFHYGPGPVQFGDLRLPDGAGPYPVVVLIHGGCWQARYDLHLMDAMAQRLTGIGLATWNLEFRRDGHESGGWPGTFQDIVLGVRYLVGLATRFELDLERVVVVGHSSGGHLALWLAGRAADVDQRVVGGRRLRILSIVALAPVADLLAVEARAELGCHGAVRSFMRASSIEQPERYRLASPAQMPGASTAQVVISGGRDEIIPTSHVRDYVRGAVSRAVPVRHIEIDSAGHFELITPESAEWTIVEHEILSALSSETEN